MDGVHKLLEKSGFYVENFQRIIYNVEKEIARGFTAGTEEILWREGIFPGAGDPIRSHCSAG